ncbi:MAG TPA: hypothetical protein VK809_09430, partial [Bacteroidia bacterium]|nr:hypothetical protein [Bacteroidia bacterium]
MKKFYFKYALIALFISVSPAIFSQNVAINTSGNNAYASAILDLSDHNLAGLVGFLPPYVNLNTPLTSFQLTGIASQSNGIIIYSTGAGTAPAGLYYWNNITGTWVAMGGATLSGGTTNYLARWTSPTTLGVGIAQDNGTEVGIQAGAYPFTPGNPLLQVTANSTNITAISGISAQTGGAGVIGSISTTGIGGTGVKGLNSSTVGGGNQFAMYGLSTSTSGNGYGIFGAATGAASINYAGYFEASGGSKNFAVVVPSGKGNSGFGTINPFSTVDDSGSFGTGTYNFTAGINTGNYTLTTLANASTYIATPPATGTYTLNLPSPPAAPRQIYTIVYYGVNLGTINIVTPANTIYQNGVASNPLPLTGGSVVLQSDGANWQVLSYNGAASANNGLSVSGTNVQLGGNNLVHASNIPLNGNTLSVTGSSEVTTYASTGQVGFGNAAPNAKSVVDLTNATNLGLMLPGITTANLPAITPAQNGLFVFNTTIGCPEYANGGVWYPLGITHGSTLYGGSSNSVQTFTIPQCVTTISVVARGASGENEDLDGGNGAIVTDNGIAVTPGQTYN